MRSQLYECRVGHARFHPKPHRFDYRIFMFAIDLDELEQLSSGLLLFSVNRRNFYSFREQDYLPTDGHLHNPAPADPAHQATAQGSSTRLKDRVLDHLRLHGIDLTGGRVMLVTLPRIFGYLFNPVSFFFCYDQHGTPVAALTEVTNTFREMKPFVIPAGETSSEIPAFRSRTPKHFYVSPFSDVDTAFDFNLRLPGERLTIQIDTYEGDLRTLTSNLHGPRRELTNARLCWFTLKYPLLTLRIITLIHWHALILWLKRIPWFSKSSRPADQRSLYRPHSSVSNFTDAP